jgi:hypothetical protein
MLILAARPAWGDLLKLDISSERSQGCHLFFTIRNRKDRMSGTRAEKPVAIYRFLEATATAWRMACIKSLCIATIPNGQVQVYTSLCPLQ